MDSFNERDSYSYVNINDNIKTKPSNESLKKKPSNEITYDDQRKSSSIPINESKSRIDYNMNKSGQYTTSYIERKSHPQSHSVTKSPRSIKRFVKELPNDPILIDKFYHLKQAIEQYDKQIIDKGNKSLEKHRKEMSSMGGNSLNVSIEKTEEIIRTLD